MKKINNKILNIQEETIAVVVLNIKRINGNVAVDMGFSCENIKKSELIQAMRLSVSSIFDHENEEDKNPKQKYNFGSKWQVQSIDYTGYLHPIFCVDFIDKNKGGKH